MSRGLILFLLLFFTAETNAQSLLGEWNISNLITDSLIQEYTLKRPSEEPWSNYGDHITLMENNIFHTHYSAPCGNDCFTTSNGKFVLLDKYHIRFSLDTVIYYKECSELTSKHSFPIDVGLFYIHRNNNEIRLVKSDGDILKDKLKMSYADAIDSVAKDSRKYTNLLNWIEPAVPFEMNLEAITANYMSLANTDNCKALFVRTTGFKTIVLLEEKDELKYLFCRLSTSDSVNGLYLQSFAVYDKQFINRIGEIVKEIDEKRYKFIGLIT